jgi:hypothetical protein
MEKVLREKSAALSPTEMLSKIRPEKSPYIWQYEGYQCP